MKGTELGELLTAIAEETPIANVSVRAKIPSPIDNFLFMVLVILRLLFIVGCPDPLITAYRLSTSYYAVYQFRVFLL